MGGPTSSLMLDGSRVSLATLPTPGEGFLFSCTHLPSTRPKALLLVCGALHAEFAKNYRREVVLGRQLARRGVAVCRFHYRGTGHSSGESSNVTMTSMVADSQVALAHAREMLGRDVPLAVLGTRLGAHVAAAVAGDTGALFVALWEPSLDVRRHFRGVFRAAIVRDLKSGSASVGTSRALSLEALGSEPIDVLGYAIHRGLVDSFAPSDVARQLAQVRALQIVQFGERGEGRADHERLAETLRADGVRAQIQSVGSSETWWFGGAGDQWDSTLEMTDLVAESSAEWLEASLAEFAVWGHA